ncbi:MAG: hypothetical protein EBS06_08480 [Proteobacteria bacterium]|nr:hypothetical protein [Pseudomonadota bacterium]
MKIRLSIATVLIMTLSSCHTVRYTDLDHFQYEKLPIKGSKSLKEGKACAEYRFPVSLFYSNADITVESAKKNAEITDIISVEDEISVAPGYRRMCKIVRGN